ncbi:MAG: hypothetical protein WAT70_10855 [Rhizobiaceae bacterium]
MFRIARARTFEWPVVIRLPSPDMPGSLDEHGFVALFEAISLDEAEKVERETGGDIVAGQKALIARVLKGWRDVVAEDGQPLAFGAEALDAALAEPWFRNGLINAYAQALRGEEARRKN